MKVIRKCCFGWEKIENSDNYASTPPEPFLNKIIKILVQIFAVDKSLSF